MKLTCHITEDMINNGIIQDCERCPVAQAIAAATDLRPVLVDFDDLHIGMDHIVPPDAVADFIETFDRCQPVKPLTFEIELPEGP